APPGPRAPCTAHKVRATGTHRKVSIRSRPAVWAGVDLGRGPNGSQAGRGPAEEPRSSSRSGGRWRAAGAVAISGDGLHPYHKARANIVRAHDGVNAARQAVSQSDSLGGRRKELRQATASLRVEVDQLLVMLRDREEWELSKIHY